ncbi:hypothetical protein M427DRAFT_27283 [Gonapodya prolifera JEL478]|uniref:Uncharacterized protein n=1 Tax=Gonapodya prolifera (strain JEL478) TaxID=1344416 RepID=A0A139AYA4_GONPJ|nr:hypothetical protein M427DRAFT_27283 [Gonapodya prolifera JEL478]|eukprot:KXS21687.1 hypothetical protein M427DRAFT_27283 [Gonapodya prolifera JEL478]
MQRAGSLLARTNTGIASLRLATPSLARGFQQKMGFPPRNPTPDAEVKVPKAQSPVAPHVLAPPLPPKYEESYSTFKYAIKSKGKGHH